MGIALAPSRARVAAEETIKQAHDDALKYLADQDQPIPLTLFLENLKGQYPLSMVSRAVSALLSRGDVALTEDRMVLLRTRAG
jgi:hypothetical protein